MNKITIYTTLLAGFTLWSSCKKDDNNNSNPNTPPSASNIPVGQCAISFNTDKDFNGTTTINIPAGNTTFSLRNSHLNKDQLTLEMTKMEVNGASAKVTKANLNIYVPSGSTGNMSGGFSGNSDVLANIIVSNLNAGQSTPAYASESGTITITKLTATELEGTFTADCVNKSENTSIKLSNGKFAAKFK